MSAGEQAAAFALSQLGKPYEWGGNGPDTYDCTGLINAAYAAAGHPEVNSRLPKTAGARYVGAADIRPGDILDYGLSHAAIAISSAEMVEAPFTGGVVRKVPIRSGITAVERVMADTEESDPSLLDRLKSNLGGFVPGLGILPPGVLPSIPNPIDAIGDVGGAAVSAARNLQAFSNFIKDRGRFILLMVAGLILTIFGAVWLNKDLALFAATKGKVTPNG